MVEKNQMLQEIMMLDFALADVTLFLDTHANDETAFAYYQKISACLKEAKQEYICRYGALSNRDICFNYYDYISGPWPWEGEKTCGYMKKDCSFQ